MIVTQTAGMTLIENEDQLEEFFTKLGVEVPDWDFDAVVDALNQVPDCHYLLLGDELNGFEISELEVL